MRGLTPRHERSRGSGSVVLMVVALAIAVLLSVLVGEREEVGVATDGDRDATGEALRAPLLEDLLRLDPMRAAPPARSAAYAESVQRERESH